MLGVPAVLGRTFASADRPESGGSPVAVISHRFWQRRFGGRPDVLGAPITVDQRPYTIIGVTPPEFSGILVGWTMAVTSRDGAPEYTRLCRKQLRFCTRRVFAGSGHLRTRPIGECRRDRFIKPDRLLAWTSRTPGRCV